MLWLLLPLIVLGALLAGRSTPTPVPFRDPTDDDADPVDLLARYGTEDDARRLIDEGHGDDLAGLGYHPDGD